MSSDCWKYFKLLKAAVTGYISLEFLMVGCSDALLIEWHATGCLTSHVLNIRNHGGITVHFSDWLSNECSERVVTVILCSSYLEINLKWYSLVSCLD